jgi:hypothetical protein
MIVGIEARAAMALKISAINSMLKTPASVAGFAPCPGVFRRATSSTYLTVD